MNALPPQPTSRAALPRLKPLGAGAAAHLSYARALFDRGELLAAREEADASIRLDPHLHLAFFLRAEVATRLGDAAAAEADCLACLRLSPRFPDAAVRLGDLYAWLERPADALKTYEDALRLGAETASTQVKVACMRFSLGEYRRADET